MISFWDNRYSTQSYVYGKNPNGFFATQLEKSAPGNILLPGEGEGRNAVYAASKGWSVDAFDQSSEGREKAFGLASENNIRINYRVCRLEDFHFKPDHYDFVALIFMHLANSDREYLHRKVCESLKPGGTLILEAFHKDQMKKDTGGPKSLDLLFDKTSLRADFESIDTLLLEKQEVLLEEGAFHHGLASVIRFIGKKP
jgi:SAM-dependent methyltransferase